MPNQRNCASPPKERAASDGHHAVKNGDSVVTKDRTATFCLPRQGRQRRIPGLQQGSAVGQKLFSEGHQRSPENSFASKKQGEGAAAMAVPYFLKYSLHSAAASQIFILKLSVFWDQLRCPYHRGFYFKDEIIKGGEKRLTLLGARVEIGQFYWNFSLRRP